jgi:hypothetical protein
MFSWPRSKGVAHIAAVEDQGEAAFDDLSAQLERQRATPESRRVRLLATARRVSSYSASSQTSSTDRRLHQRATMVAYQN